MAKKVFPPRLIYVTSKQFYLGENHDTANLSTEGMGIDIKYKNKS